MIRFKHLDSLTIELIVNSNAAKLKRNQILSIKIDLDPIWNLTYLYVHDWHSIPTGWSWDTIAITPGKRYALSFEKKTLKRLKSPYGTDCIDYEKSTPFQSRHHCLTHCRIKKSLEVCAVIGDETNVVLNQSGRFAQSPQDVDCIEKLTLDKNCWDSCSHPDCTANFFRAVKYFEKPVEPYFIGNTSYDSCVMIRIPLEPQTVFNYKPKLETIEFLCYVASLIGLWFGLSIASINVPIKRLIHWFESNKSNQKLFSLRDHLNDVNRVVMTQTFIGINTSVIFNKHYYCVE